VKIHVVQRGESLWLLSQRYGVGINQIIAVNELANPNQLVIGLALVIPTPPFQYMVRNGDSLWIIAHRYGTTVQAIMQENQIYNPALIYPGQILRIPEKFRPAIDVNAFTGRFGDQGVQIVRNVAPHLTYLSPFAYRIRDDGSLKSINDNAVSKLRYRIIRSTRLRCAWGDSRFCYSNDL
jgi:spore germination protein